MIREEKFLLEANMDLYKEAYVNPLADVLYYIDALKI